MISKLVLRMAPKSRFKMQCGAEIRRVRTVEAGQPEAPEGPEKESWPAWTNGRGRQ